MVWATTATVNARTVQAAPALTAYSAAAVARGDAAVTDYDDLITDAHAQVVEILRQRDITEEMVTSTAGVTRAETDLTLALLFEALLQIARDGSGDQYAQQASFFRASFEREMDRAQPITDVKGSGRGFRWARG